MTEVQMVAETIRGTQILKVDPTSFLSQVARVAFNQFRKGHIPNSTRGTIIVKEKKENGVPPTG